MNYSTYKDIKPENCGIYIIKNKISGKVYIGQSHNIKWRWTAHKNCLRANRCSNRHLQASWNKYGEDAFDFSILELCGVADLDDREAYWIDRYDATNSGYNIRPGGNSRRGWKMSDEARKHISDVLKGKKKPEWLGKQISERQKQYYETHIPTSSKPVVCLNTGEVFVNSSAAHKKYNSADTSAMHEQCKGKHRSCGKSDTGEHLVWAYLEDYQQMTEDEICSRLSFVGSTAAVASHLKPVKCLETGMIFNSCKEAAAYAGITRATLNDCLSGRTKHAGRHPETGERLSWAPISDT